MTSKPDNEPIIDAYARDMRISRAIGSGSEKYEIGRCQNDESGLVVFAVSGGKEIYEVTVDPEWRCRPTCTCPDASSRAQDQTGGFCKHIILVLFKNPEFKHQLIEMYL